MAERKFRIDLFYDVYSPYSWIAFEALLRYQHIWPIEVCLRPFSLGAVMKATGNRPPGMLKERAVYMQKDIRRNNEFWGMNIRPNPNFMDWITKYSSENAMKLLLVIQQEKPDMLETVTREFWKRIWSEAKPIFHADDFEEVLSASGISNGSMYIDKLDKEPFPSMLQQNTSEALEAGAYGAPWIVVHKDGEKHSFFGSDRMHLIAHLIGEKFTDGLVKYAKI